MLRGLTRWKVYLLNYHHASIVIVSLLIWIICISTVVPEHRLTELQTRLLVLLSFAIFLYRATIWLLAWIVVARRYVPKLYSLYNREGAAGGGLNRILPSLSSIQCSLTKLVSLWCLIVNREKRQAGWPLGNWCHSPKLAGALWIWIE